MGRKRRIRYGCFLPIAILLLMAGVVLGPALPKLDYGEIASRASWQLPVRVIEALELEAGDVVADIGAGDGYFTFYLADAVGPRSELRHLLTSMTTRREYVSASCRR